MADRLSAEDLQVVSRWLAQDQRPIAESSGDDKPMTSARAELLDRRRKLR
jgi:hypothetical protein